MRLLFAECAGLAVLTAYLMVLVVTAEPGSLPVAISLTVMAAIGVFAVFLVARALGRRSARARGPAIVVQLFVIASGGFLLQTGPAWAGAAMMALGVGVAVLCLLPASTRALGLD
ncbi:hypothetical protein Asp14428_58370 [Actinoplanes sp. NBRC 14428]|uniref:Uncharacterized protein n=1 Tax=Pseudosporangium ferrugineum TaxID=439699 RepID=A0A2T0SDK1_9ACTN|nr:hypothetical protein CLV70_103381 [Pseudosporangium ferrugineum]BCJ54362.1 hypothetical protein Asp14428_58370 [Actinoplanes sp. NBRC 14428]